jgi:hypothetical protein
MAETMKFNRHYVPFAQLNPLSKAECIGAEEVEWRSPGRRRDSN